LEETNVLRKNVAEFPIQYHLPSRRDILTTVAPNIAKSEPMKIRHP